MFVFFFYLLFLDLLPRCGKIDLINVTLPTCLAYITSWRYANIDDYCEPEVHRK